MVFGVRDENWFLLLNSKLHKSNEVYGVTRRSFIGGSLQCNEEGEAAFNHGSGESVIRAIIMRLDVAFWLQHILGPGVRRQGECK